MTQFTNGRGRVLYSRQNIDAATERVRITQLNNRILIYALALALGLACALIGREVRIDQNLTSHSIDHRAHARAVMRDFTSNVVTHGRLTDFLANVSLVKRSLQRPAEESLQELQVSFEKAMDSFPDALCVHLFDTNNTPVVAVTRIPQHAQEQVQRQFREWLGSLDEQRLKATSISQSLPLAMSSDRPAELHPFYFVRQPVMKASGETLGFVVVSIDSSSTRAGLINILGAEHEVAISLRTKHGLWRTNSAENFWRFSSPPYLSLVEEERQAQEDGKHFFQAAVSAGVERWETSLAPWVVSTGGATALTYGANVGVSIGRNEFLESHGITWTQTLHRAAMWAGLFCLLTFLFRLVAQYMRAEREKHRTAYLTAKREAERDFLTGVASRRFAQKYLLDIVNADAQRVKKYCCILIDVDHFKQVNDRYGHAVGDECLKHIARCIQSELRDRDLPFRWGGEEFGVIVELGDEVARRTVCERIRQRVEQESYYLQSGEAIRLTVSIGYFGLQVDLEATFASVDDALYRAKRVGRNRVVAGVPLAADSTPRRRAFEGVDDPAMLVSNEVRQAPVRSL